MKGEKPLIIYDNHCLFCISYKNKIGKLDKRKKMEWVGIDKFNNKKYKLRKEDLFKEMHLVYKNKVYKGYYAWKQIAKRIPLLVPLYAFSLIPGINFLGKKVYKIIAKHRYKL